MLPYAIVGLAALVALIGALLCAGQLWRLRRATSIAPDIPQRLARIPEVDRPAALARWSRTGSWEAALARAMLETEGEARIAVVNEAVAELGSRLDERAAWPATGLRLTAFATMLLAIVALIGRRTDLVLPLAGIGGVAVLGCAEAARRARDESLRQRQVVDAIVATAMGTPDCPPPGPGHARRVRCRGTSRNPR